MIVAATLIGLVVVAFVSAVIAGADQMAKPGHRFPVGSRRGEGAELELDGTTDWMCGSCGDFVCTLWTRHRDPRVYAYCSGCGTRLKWPDGKVRK